MKKDWLIVLPVSALLILLSWNHLPDGQFALKLHSHGVHQDNFDLAFCLGLGGRFELRCFRVFYVEDSRRAQDRKAAGDWLEAMAGCWGRLGFLFAEHPGELDDLAPTCKCEEEDSPGVTS